MELFGAPKLRFRIGLMHLFMQACKLKYVPEDECIFGLGAQYADKGILLKGSEYDTFLNTKLPQCQKSFIEPQQYISVEGWKKSIYQENIALDGPKCIWGDFSRALKEFSGKPDSPAIAIINADFMCGIDTALPQIKTIFESLANAKAPRNTGGSLIAINVILDDRYMRVLFGKKFSPPLETLKQQSWFRALLNGSVKRDKLVLIDSYAYANKTTGRNSGCVKMQTFVFWWGLKRDLSGIKGWVRKLPSVEKPRQCRVCHKTGHRADGCSKGLAKLSREITKQLKIAERVEREMRNQVGMNYANR